MEELGRERERNEGGVQKREKMVKIFILYIIYRKAMLDSLHLHILLLPKHPENIAEIKSKFADQN